LSDCAGCFHPKENHKPVKGENGEFFKKDDFECSICTATIECSCEHYEEPYLMEFAQDIAKVKYESKNIYDRVVYILKNIPQMRNASQKTFGRVYNEIWHGVKIRKYYSNLTTEVWDRSKASDSINREVRRAKRENDTLKTYDPKVIRKHVVVYQAMMEMAIEH